MKSSLVLKSVLIAATAILSLLQRSHGAPVITTSEESAYGVNHSPLVTDIPYHLRVIDKNVELEILQKSTTKLLEKSGPGYLVIQLADKGFWDDPRICDAFLTTTTMQTDPFWKYENIILLKVIDKVYDECFRKNIKKMKNAIAIIVLREEYSTESEKVKSAQQIINQRSNLQNLTQFDLIDKNGRSFIQSSLEELATATDEKIMNLLNEVWAHRLIVYTSLLNLGYYNLKYSNNRINYEDRVIPKEVIFTNLVKAVIANKDHLSTILFMAIKELNEEQKSEILSAWKPTALNPWIQTMYLKHDIVTIDDISQESIKDVLKNSVRFGFTDVVEKLVNKIESNRAANKLSIKLAIEMIELSAEYGHLDIFKFFIQKAGGLDKIKPDWNNIIKTADSWGHMNIFEYYLQLSPEYRRNFQGEPERYMLRKALTQNDAYFVKIILDLLNIEDVDRPFYDDKTLLMVAAKYSKPKIFEMFLKHEKLGESLHINFANYRGNTALTDAVIGGCLENVKLLLTHKTPAKVDIVTDEGKNVIILAAEWGKTEIFQHLFGMVNKSYITEKDNDGTTALMYAVRGGYIEIVKFLLKETDKEYMMKQDNSRRDAFVYAVQSGNIDLVNLFTAYLPV